MAPGTKGKEIISPGGNTSKLLFDLTPTPLPGDANLIICTLLEGVSKDLCAPCDILRDLCGKYKSLNHKGSQRFTQSHTKGKHIKYYF